MTVISNATPLINFAAISRLDILQSTFGRILIPQAVRTETISPNFRGSQDLLRAIASGWLQVYPIATIPREIPAELDDGEREAIALAVEIGESRILLDEREARKVARSWGLQILGTLGTLVLAKERQIIPQIQPLLDEMIDTAQYWVSESLYRQVLRRAGEL